MSLVRLTFPLTKRFKKANCIIKLLLFKIANSYSKDSIQNAFRNHETVMKRPSSHKEYLSITPTAIVRTTLVKCRRKFTSSLRLPQLKGRLVSLLAEKLMNTVLFKLFCKQPSLEFVRHFELSRETADHSQCKQVGNHLCRGLNGGICVLVCRFPGRFDLRRCKNFTMIMHHLV